MKAFGKASMTIMLVHLLSFGQVSTLREYEAERRLPSDGRACLRPSL